MYQNSRVLKLAFLNFGFIVPLALLGIILVKKFPQSWLLYLFWTVLSVSVIAFHIQERYRMATVPFFILFAGYALYWLTVQLKTRKFTALAAGLAVIFLGVVFTKIDEGLIDKYFGSRIRKVDYGNLADSYFVYSQHPSLTVKKKNEMLNQGILYYQKALATPSPLHKGNPQLESYYSTNLKILYSQLNEHDH